MKEEYINEKSEEWFGKKASQNFECNLHFVNYKVLIGMLRGPKHTSVWIK